MGASNGGEIQSKKNAVLAEISTPANDLGGVANDKDCENSDNLEQSKKTVENVFKRTKGTPDTDTTGVNAKRYRFVKNRILKGMVKPSVNAVKQVVYGDKKMGVSTAQKYLDAMVNEGLLRKEKNRYALP